MVKLNRTAASLILVIINRRYLLRSTLLPRYQMELCDRLSFAVFEFVYGPLFMLLKPFKVQRTYFLKLCYYLYM
jgi:hypothetical protein